MVQNQKSTVIITGASSGVGLQAARALAQTGTWFVIMACRDVLKGERAAIDLKMPRESYKVMHMDLACLDTVRLFVKNFRDLGRTLDALVCNAAVYMPTSKEPRRSAEGYELSVATNHLGHFLLANLMLDDLKKASAPRLVILGTVTHNPEELGGSIPPRPDLGNLDGLAAGFLEPYSMIDGGKYNPVKAYKDSKVCNVLTMKELHRRYHQSTGIVFTSLYPGCVATTALFRESPRLFQILFPYFQRYITGGFVSEELSGQRLADVVSLPEYGESGAYWSWGNRQKKDGKSFNKTVSKEARDEDKAVRMWELSEKLVGLTPSKSLATV